MPWYLGSGVTLLLYLYILTDIILAYWFNIQVKTYK